MFSRSVPQYDASQKPWKIEQEGGTECIGVDQEKTAVIHEKIREKRKTAAAEETGIIR